MERVLGVGGYFIRAADPVALGAWYRDCLGLDADQNGLWRQEAGVTVFATFESETEYFGSRAQTTMLNFRVRDLDAMLAQLRAKGADVAEETQDMEGVGRFGWGTDPEGNRIELWHPPRPGGAWRAPGRPPVFRGDRPEQAVRLLGGAGAEDQRVLRGERPVPEAEPPQAGERDGLARPPTETSEELPVRAAVGVDRAVAEVADEQRAPEGAEPLRRDDQPPRGVQAAALDQPVAELALGAEDVDVAVAGPGDVVHTARLALRVGHVDRASDRLYPERSVVPRDLLVGEAGVLDAVEG